MSISFRYLYLPTKPMQPNGRKSLPNMVWIVEWSMLLSFEKKIFFINAGRVDLRFESSVAVVDLCFFAGGVLQC